MVRVFLDTNKFIDVTVRNPKIRAELSGLRVFISPLSIHILCYTEGIKIPNDHFFSYITDQYEIINLDNTILTKSLGGPTTDLEDNIQLHSAAFADCTHFLTSDKKLLTMKYFGTLEMVSTLPPVAQ